MIKIGSINSIRGAIESGTAVKLYVNNPDKQCGLLRLAKEANIPVELVSKEKLSSFGIANQGVIALCKEITPVGVEEILHIASKKTNPIVVMLDELNDPHNLGAILRSSDAFDVSGIVYKKRGQVSLNDTVIKVSTGAANFVKCAEVTNLTRTIKQFKDKGFWVVGLDGSGEMTLTDAPKNVPILLVTGSEGHGISRLVRENCDYIVKIPMLGKVNCLNASVACSIALYSLRTF